MSSVTVRAATAADVPRIAAIHYAALNQYHEFYAAFFAAHPRDTLPASIERAFHSRDTAFLVAEDAQTHSVLGFVRWKVLDPTAAAVAPGVSGGGGGGSTVPSLFRMKDYLDEVWKRFAVKDDEMEACYEGAAAGEKHYYVQHLMIDPSHQRKGIGRTLLSAVLRKAQDDRLPTFLMSSAESFGLYRDMGFEDLGRWTVDNGFWMREVAAREAELGITGAEGLVARYEGVEEVENVMVKRPELP